MPRVDIRKIDWEYWRKPKVQSEAEYRRSKIKSMLSSQDYSCKTCGKEFKDGVKYYIDHSHQTGWLRGLLCFSCNVALGHVKDNVQTLKVMIMYLNDELW